MRRRKRKKSSGMRMASRKACTQLWRVRLLLGALARISTRLWRPVAMASWRWVVHNLD
jgi:hypothetical protein